MQGTYEFMSDQLLRAMGRGSPVDDLFSFYFTMQWAAAFNNQEFTVKAIPLDLDWVRKDLSRRRILATHEIIHSAKLKGDRYGHFLVSCQPFLRSWHSSLLDLEAEFQECHSQLQESKLESEGDAYTALFSVFAVKGVAQLAELVRIHIQNMS